MAFTSDGSRICDSNRNPLVAIDASYTLVDKATEFIIYAIAMIGVTGDRMRTSGTVTLHFRALGGTFAAITNTGAVKIAQSTFATALVNGNSVTAALAKNNKTPTFIEGGREVETGSTTTTSPSIEIRDVMSGEWQFALDFSGAAAGTTYEFKAVVVQDLANADIVYAAQVTTSIGIVGVGQATASFGATSLSLTRTAGAVNNLLIASCGYTGVREAAATISDTQGNTWFPCNPDVNDAINTWRLASWYALAKNTTSTTVTILSNSSSSVMTITLSEFLGTASVAPLDQATANVTGNSSDNTLASPVFTPRYDSELVWAIQFDNTTIVGTINTVAATLLTNDANGTVSEFRVLPRQAGKAMQATFGDGGLTDILVASFMRPLSIAAPQIVQKQQVRPFPYAPGSPRS